MLRPRSGQWRCHCTLPASLPDGACASPFRAQRSRKAREDFAHSQLKPAWRKSLIVDAASTAVTARPAGGEVVRSATRPSELQAPRQRVHVMSSPIASLIRWPFGRRSPLPSANERLSQPALDLLVRDCLRQRERGRAQREDLARPRWVGMAAAAGGEDDRSEQRAVCRRKHGVVDRFSRGFAHRVHAARNTRPRPPQAGWRVPGSRPPFRAAGVILPSHRDVDA
jgi:hypothetical protein